MGQLFLLWRCPYPITLASFHNSPLLIGRGLGEASLCCPPRSRTSLLGTKIRCNTDIRVDNTIYDWTIYDVRFIAFSSKVGAKVLLFFDIRKYFALKMQITLHFCLSCFYLLYFWEPDLYFSVIRPMDHYGCLRWASGVFYCWNNFFQYAIVNICLRLYLRSFWASVSFAKHFLQLWISFIFQQSCITVIMCRAWNFMKVSGNLSDFLW